MEPEPAGRQPRRPPRPARGHRRAAAGLDGCPPPGPGPSSPACCSPLVALGRLGAGVRHRRATAYRRAALAELARPSRPALDGAATRAALAAARRRCSAAPRSRPIPAPRSRRSSGERLDSRSSPAPAATSRPSGRRSPPRPTRARPPSTAPPRSPRRGAGSPATMLELAFPWALLALPLPLLVLWLAPAAARGGAGGPPPVLRGGQRRASTRARAPSSCRARWLADGLRLDCSGRSSS